MCALIQKYSKRRTCLLINSIRMEELMIKLNKQKINEAMEIADNSSGLEALATLPEMDMLEIVNNYESPISFKNTLKMVLFNIERGTYLNEIIVYLKHHPALRDADIIFFNELDYGLLRTENKNISAEISKELGMNYIFGIEFMELTTNGKKGQNQEAFHGNAIMSRFKLYDPIILRLPLLYDWYQDEQKRFGTRIAIFAKILVRDNEIGLICTHLENRTTPEGRKVQMKTILEEAEKRFDNIPIVIAGDMNTNTFDGSKASEAMRMYEAFKAEPDRIKAPEKYEPLLELVKNYGYDYMTSNVTGKITRRKPIAGKGILEMNLDWFFTRGMRCLETTVVNTIFTRAELLGVKNMEESEGIEISDHNAICGKFIVDSTA